MGPERLQSNVQGVVQSYMGRGIGTIAINVQGVVQSNGEGCWDHYNQMYRGLSNLNYGEGPGVGTIAIKCTGGCLILIIMGRGACWDHCNQM